MLAALWALLLSDVRLTSLPSAPRFGDDRSALLRGGAQSQMLREWSDSDVTGTLILSHDWRTQGRCRGCRRLQVETFTTLRKRDYKARVKTRGTAGLVVFKCSKLLTYTQRDASGGGEPLALP